MTSPLSVLGTLTPNGLPLARQLVRRGLGRILGPPQVDPARDPGDPGLFGPDSASWQLVGDVASIVGGVRALLVQVLHPLAVAGVADHSAFREDPLQRLHGTSAYVTVTTFGSTVEAVRAARRVRGAHRPVVGTAPDGRGYRASAPWLLTVVSAAFTGSLLAADRAYAAAPLDDAAADAFVAEQARGTALLDPRVDLDLFDPQGPRFDPAALVALRAGRHPLPLVDDGLLPTTVAELTAVRERIAAEQAITGQTRELLDFLLWPDLAAPVKAAYLPVLAGALATLDPGDLRLLGAPPVPGVAPLVRAQTRAALDAFRLTVGTSPAQRAARERHAAA